MLCEEYVKRKKIDHPFVRYISKGFAIFGPSKKLLVIKWTQCGAHPGFYEISECLLEKNIICTFNKNISWDEYENYILNWVDTHDKIIDEKKIIFKTVWEYFLRKNDKVLSENYDPQEIYETIDGDDSQNLIKCFSFLENLSKNQPKIAEFWHQKASEVISKYSYWLAELKID